MYGLVFSMSNLGMEIVGCRAERLKESSPDGQYQHHLGAWVSLEMQMLTWNSAGGAQELSNQVLYQEWGSCVCVYVCVKAMPTQQVGGGSKEEPQD